MGKGGPNTTARPTKTVSTVYRAAGKPTSWRKSHPGSKAGRPFRNVAGATASHLTGTFTSSLITRGLIDGKISKLARKRRVKPQDNPIFRNASLSQFFSNHAFCPIMMNPYLIVLDVNMQNTTINPPVFLPTHRDKLVMIAYGIKNHLRFEFRGKRMPFAHIAQATLALADDIH